MIELDFKEYFRIDFFIFRDWGKNPSQLDTMELTDMADMCRCDTGLGGWRYVTPLDPSFRAMMTALIRTHGP